MVKPALFEDGVFLAALPAPLQSFSAERPKSAAEGKRMRRTIAIALFAALAACGTSIDLSQNCSMNVAVNGGSPAAVSCVAVGASTPGIGNAVTIEMNGTLPGISAAQFSMTLPSAPAEGTYAAANVSSALGQVATTGGAYYSNVGTAGTFSVVLTSVSALSSNGQTAYFLHGTATVTLAGQAPAPGSATITATF